MKLWSAILVIAFTPVSYTHLRAHETVLDLVCRLLLEIQQISLSLPMICHHTQIITFYNCIVARLCYTHT